MSVTVAHYKKRDLDLERVIISRRVKGSGVIGKVQFGAEKKCLMVEPLDGHPYIYESGGYFTEFRRDDEDAWSRLRARHECQALFDQLNGGYRLPPNSRR